MKVKYTLILAAFAFALSAAQVANAAPEEKPAKAEKAEKAKPATKAKGSDHMQMHDHGASGMTGDSCCRDPNKAAKQADQDHNHSEPKK